MQAPGLPDAEVVFLTSLPLLPRCRRIQALCGEGWSLQSVANAFSPPRRRSTIRSWLLRPLLADDPNTAYDALLAPPLSKPPTRKAKLHRKRAPSPGIDHPTQIQIARLAPLARRYRSRTLSSSPSAVSNVVLSQLAVELYSSGVRVSELARAGAVTYRAMKRRIEKEQAKHD